MKPKIVFKYQDILKVLSEFPELIKINQNFKRNEGYEKSLKKDKILENNI